jgi:hypothetical protein
MPEAHGSKMTSFRSRKKGNSNVYEGAVDHYA